MDQPTRPWYRALYLPALVAVIALVAAASAWAAHSAPGETTSVPAQYQPVQDNESVAPAQSDGDRPDGHDCPEGHPGRGPGDGGATPPDARQPSPGTTPDSTATPDV